MRAFFRSALIGLIVVLAVAPAGAELFSKKYVFKEEVVLQIGADVGRGVRLDAVYFHERPGGRSRGAAGPLGVDVRVTNTASESRSVAVAVALFDDAGRLLGVARAGERDTAMSGGKKRVMAMSFSGVGAFARTASTFQISLEID